MSRIQILAPEVAHKIAAGEVVERPASVVKELVENSIDALATQVTIEIREGGLEFIRVQDNGVGIYREELELAFQPHATSKITSAEDLFGLYTLGFRGEALPSIASVAKLVLFSRPSEQSHGYKIQKSEGGFKVEPAGTPPGTTVEVSHLFYNVPARRKFLRKPVTERRRVLEIATHLALGHPHIAFRLVAEGKTVLATPGNGRLLDTILLVEGKNIAKDLTKLQAKFAWGEIFGYLGAPRLAKGNRNGQIFILNGRVIQNATLRAALEKAYSGLLQTRTFPWAIINLAIDPQAVDCNVHPTKAEVRFADEQAIYSDVFQAIRSALMGPVLAPSLETVKEEPARSNYRTRPAQSQLQWEPETWQFMDQLLREYRPTRDQKTEGQKPSIKLQIQPERKEKEVIKEARTEDLTEVRSQLKNARIIGQLHQSYILLEVNEGLWLLDQHIVHERILIERLQSQWEEQAIHTQELVMPLTLEFTPSEASLIEESRSALEEFGLELEEFGHNSFLLRGVPSSLSVTAGNWKEEILEIAENMKKTTTGKEAALITLACRGAIKAGDYLDTQVIRSLLDDLAQTDNPFTCPHGRPIIVRLKNDELLRRFGRI